MNEVAEATNQENNDAVKATNRKPDFSGWLCKYDKPGFRGVKFDPDCLINENGESVPLLTYTTWFLSSADPESVIGHCIIKKKDEGVYVDCYLNENEHAEKIKETIETDIPKSFIFWATNDEWDESYPRYTKVKKMKISAAALYNLESDTTYIDVIKGKKIRD